VPKSLPGEVKQANWEGLGTKAQGLGEKIRRWGDENMGKFTSSLSASSPSPLALLTGANSPL
jgi:hypothetical protein